MSTLRDRIPLQARKIIKKSFSRMATMLFWAVVFTAIFFGGLEYFTGGSAELSTRYEQMWQTFVWSWMVVVCCLVFWPPFYEFLYYRSYFYDTDEKNVLIRKGIIAKREITLPFSKITDVYVDQDLVDVVLGLYDVHISTPTVESGKFAHIDGLNKKGAVRLRKLILDKVNETEE